MTPKQMRIGDQQLDDALRTIAGAPAAADLPASVLRAIHQEAPIRWWPTWRPALVAVAVTVVALAAIVVWRLAPARPGHIVVSRMDPAPHPTSAHSAAAQPRTSPPREAHGSGRTVQGRPSPAQASELMAERSEADVPALIPPEPLTIARVQTPEFSEAQLHVNGIHVPALEIETLDR